MATSPTPAKAVVKTTAKVPSPSTPLNPMAQYTGGNPGDPLAQYTGSLLPKPGAPNVNVGSGSYGDMMLGATTGGAITNSAQFQHDVDARTKALASGTASPVGGVGGGGSDPYASALAQAVSSYGASRGDLLAHEGRADTDLAQLFARTQNAQRMLQSNAIKGFHENGARIGSTYDDLLQRIGSSYGQGAGSLAAELKRLGIQAAGPGASEGLVRDAAFSDTRARNDRADALTNNNAASSLIANLMSDLRGNTAAAGASARAQNHLTTQQALASLAQQLSAAKSNIASGRTSSGGKAPLTTEEKAQRAHDLAQAKAHLQLEDLLKLVRPASGFGMFKV